MKAGLLVIALTMLLHRESFSQQQTYPLHPQTRQEYFQKSNNQRIGGFVLLGAGIAGIAAVSSGNASFNTTGTVALLGSAAILGSIPLFLAAHRNKKKAMRMEAYMGIDKHLEDLSIKMKKATGGNRVLPMN